MKKPNGLVPFHVEFVRSHIPESAPLNRQMLHHCEKPLLIPFLSKRATFWLSPDILNLLKPRTLPASVLRNFPTLNNLQHKPY